MWNLKRLDANELIYKAETSLTDLEMNLKGCQREGWGEGIVREFGMDRYRLTLLYLK